MKHNRLLVVFVLLATMMLLLFTPCAAQAITLKMDLQDMSIEADSIITGRVIDCSSQWNEDHTRINTLVVVSVEEGLKGFFKNKDTITITVPGGEVDGIREWVSDTPVFVPNERAAIFLKQYQGKAGFNVVGGFQGKLSIIEDKIGKLPVADFKKLVNNALNGETVPSEIEDGLNAGGVTISGISPSTASAGTDSVVTIYGEGFGDSQGEVHFFYKNGQPTIAGSVISWSNSEIVVKVPVATINNYPASAGSGPVYVRTAAGTNSNSYPFTVTFSYYGAKWSGENPVVNYKVNPNTSDCAGEEIAVQNAANTWNAVPNKRFTFSYAGASSVTAPQLNGSNDVSWGSLQSGILAQAVMWLNSSSTLRECDIQFNDNYTWSTSAVPPSGSYDVQSILLHEMGHWLSLRDLYGNVTGYPSDSAKVMYGFGYSGERKRVLHESDIAGIKWIYPGNESYCASGIVTDNNGILLQGVTMTFTRVSGDGAVPASVVTDSSGCWSQAGFETGTTYQVTPGKQGYDFTPSNHIFNSFSSNLNFTGLLASPSVSVSVNASSIPVGTLATVTATATGVNNPVYEFWVKNPKDDTWSSRPFSSSNNYTFTKTVPGEYTVYTYCKGADAPYSSTVSAPPATVTFTKDNAVCALTVNGPNGSQPVGSSATFTATATDHGGIPMYQFWVHDNSGWRVAQDYSTTNTFTMSNLQCGSYTVAAYALDSTDITSGNWGATYVKAFVLNVNSGVSLNAPASSVQAGSSVNITAQADCLTGVVYQFWYQTPDGGWHSSGGYTTSNSYSFTAGTSGSYKVIVYAKDHYAPDTDQFAVWDMVTIDCY